MRIGLIDVDSHNFPNLALMKLSAYFKSRGHAVEWWSEAGEYEKVLISKVFSSEYTKDVPDPRNALEVYRGGTAYGKQDHQLPPEVEQAYPDYSLYSSLTQETAFGFLTRGCPRNCPFCIVSEKEGRQSRKVADLEQFWSGQNTVKLLDPNIAAAPDAEELMQQLVDSRAIIDFTQGLDIRLMSDSKIALLNQMRIRRLHFAWDNLNAGMEQHFKNFTEKYKRKSCSHKVVYVLTNFNSSMEENLYRIYKLRELGYDPYVMVYNKHEAPKEVKRLQRWVNNRKIWRKCERFEGYGR
jgi:radical SAM superfamily enzyme YgiQ (UPF0313 family)